MNRVKSECFLRKPDPKPSACIQGYILRIPANFYGELFAEEEAKKADDVLEWKVSLKRYKTRTYTPRYSFKDADNLWVCR